MAPDAFRFAQPGKLVKVLAEAGAIAPTERLLQFNIEAPISAEDFWTLRCEMSDKLRWKIARLSPEQLTEAKRQVVEGHPEYFRNGGMSLPAEVLIMSGAKSGQA